LLIIQAPNAYVTISFITVLYILNLVLLENSLLVKSSLFIYDVRIAEIILSFTSSITLFGFNVPPSYLKQQINFIYAFSIFILL
jgi:hypothetical protein